jgi:hypothetical protein
MLIRTDDRGDVRPHMRFGLDGERHRTDSFAANIVIVAINHTLVIKTLALKAAFFIVVFVSNIKTRPALFLRLESALLPTSADSTDDVAVTNL